MNTKFKKVTRILGAFAILGAIIACGGGDDDSADPATTTGAQPATTAEGVAAAQPAAGAAAVALTVGQAPAALNVPTPPSFDITIATAAEYQVDISATGGDPRLFLYQGETLVEDDDDGGEGNNARIVRFLTPGTYQARVVEYRARPFSVQGQVQQLQPPTPIGALTLGAPLVIQFPEFNFMNRPENDRGASKSATLTIAAAGQYTCTATMDNDRRVKMEIISNGAVVASDDQGFTESNASITQQLQPGAYEVRVWDSIYRGETRATVTCNQG